MELKFSSVSPKKERKSTKASRFNIKTKQVVQVTLLITSMVKASICGLESGGRGFKSQLAVLKYLISIVYAALRGSFCVPSGLVRIPDCHKKVV